MQTQNSKINTVILIVLVLMAGVIIGLLLAGNKTKVPVTTPVQTTAQESVPTTVNTVTETKTEIPVTKNYSNNNFSFNYYGNASVKVLSGNANNPTYSVNEPNGDFPDNVMFFTGPIPKEYDSCSAENVKMFNVQIKTTLINGKPFTYCDNTQGEPTRTYIFTKNDKSTEINKSLVIYVLKPLTSTSKKPQDGYVDLNSIQIK